MIQKVVPKILSVLTNFEDLTPNYMDDRLDVIKKNEFLYGSDI